MLQSYLLCLASFPSIMLLNEGETVMMSIFGRNLRDHRMHMEMTQQELANTVGLSRGYIQKLESGHYDPSLSAMLLIAKALSCTVNDLVY
jgi:DNA-binding XRE family transcriptional regulator